MDNLKPDLSDLYDELYPICRSITGEGIQKSLKIMAKYMPLNISGVASGTQVFDWKVPPEWRVLHARLFDPDGKKILDFEDHNLHIVNFSESFQGELDLDELQSHLHSSPNLPDAIPYVTSYYQPRWGFCLTQRQRDRLKAGTYKIDIKTEKKDGVLNYASTQIKGQTDKTILITSYMCHPSMANNELSGPLAFLNLYYAVSQIKNPYYTFRFVLIPETIGSITYLHKYGDELKHNIYAGLVLTCLGGPNESLSFKMSRRDWLDEPSPLDNFIRHLAHHHPNNIKIRPFTPASGSDERQFCSPGFNFPVLQAARTKYGEYDEYHTSADNKAFMRIERVEASAKQLAGILSTFNFYGPNIESVTPYGEPQLGRRGLYPNINSPMNRNNSNDSVVDSRTSLNRILKVLNLSDGRRNIIGIANQIGCSALDLLPILEELFAKGLLRRTKNVATRKRI